MKIIRIQGKNLASIAGEFEIDFTVEPLHSAGIFAICGPTGSGKSTILDAICLALFNNTPRTTGVEGTKIPDVGQELIQQGDRRQILRRGCTEATAAVEFIAIDGKPYRSVWRVWRANNKINGKLQPAELRVYDLATNTPITTGITEAENKLTQLIGLNYNQFTRTVLLAQNEFARFLKARKEEKAEVLEKLTGTEIYSIISNIVYTKTAGLRSEWKEISNRMGTICLLTEEEFKQLQKQQADILLQEKSLQQKQEDIQHKIKWFEQLKQIMIFHEEAQKQLQEAQTHQNEALAENQWLQQLEKIESSRPLWQEKTESTDQLHLQTSLLQQSEQKFIILIQKNDKLIQSANQQKILVNKYTTEYNKIKPEIINARSLDIKISNAHKAKQESQQVLTSVHKKVLEEQTIQSNRNKQILQLQEEQTILNTWFNKNGQHEQMCLNMSLIEGFLDTAYSIQLQINKHRSDSQVLQQQAKAIQTSSESQQLELNKCTLRYENILQNIRQQQELVNTIPILQLRIKKDQLQIQREKLLQVITLLEKLDKNQQELVNRSGRQQDQQKQLEKIEQQIVQYRKEIEIIGIKYSTLRHSLEQAQLAVSNHVTTLRNQLENDKPCPVCGSCQHPYSNGDVTVSHLFDSLRQETNQCEKEYDHLKTEHIRLEAEHKHLMENIQTLQQDQNSLGKECEGIKQQLNYIHSDTEQFPSTNFKDLQELLKQSLKDLEIIRQQEYEWEKHQLLLETNQKESEKLKFQLEVLHTTFQDTREKQIGIINELSKINGIIENLNLQKDEALNKVIPLISIENWLQRWEKNYKEFKQELSSAAEKWQIKTDQLEENKKQLVQLSAEYDENQKNLNSLLKNEAELTDVYHNRTEELTKLSHERSQLLQGQSADDTENYWQCLLEKTQRDQETTIQQRDQAVRESEQLKGKITQISTVLNQYKERIEKSTHQLQKWLYTYNQTAINPLTEETLSTFLQTTPEEIQQKRERQNRLRDQVTTALATLREREKQQIFHLQLPGHPDPTLESSTSLQSQYTILQQEAENILHLKTEILTELHTQTINRKQIETLKEELEEKTSLFNKWSKLDELIGSQSGYKFKEIAQGYTLEILLSYANKQLRELTPRYQLQRIPDELALQVIDHDLCDEARSVYSLSGGESFLVSLALALGLSSFSSRNHFEENLFIDEGFGTLDTETLQVVMEALERLRSQGRQVGIISHVQELTERIPAKICLVKTGNGKSKVSIE